MKGEVIKWFDDKGYGFVKTEDNKSYFLHISQMQNNDKPKVGDNIKFEATETDRGLQAHNAMIV